MLTAALIGIGGSIGAVARYLVSLALARTSFPFATLLVNVMGSFILGIAVFRPVGGDTAMIVGVGFCGAFTTFSSFSFQTAERWRAGDRSVAVINGTANFVLSMIALLLGVAIVG